MPDACYGCGAYWMHVQECVLYRFGPHPSICDEHRTETGFWRAVGRMWPHLDLDRIRRCECIRCGARLHPHYRYVMTKGDIELRGHPMWCIACCKSIGLVWKTPIDAIEKEKR